MESQESKGTATYSEILQHKLVMKGEKLTCGRVKNQQLWQNKFCTRCGYLPNRDVLLTVQAD